jgi:hypothetical protein
MPGGPPTYVTYELCYYLSFNKNKKVSWVELGPTLVYLSKAMRFGTYSSSEALGTSTKYCSTVVVSRICLVQVFAGKESGLIDY